MEQEKGQWTAEIKYHKCHFMKVSKKSTKLSILMIRLLYQ